MNPELLVGKEVQHVKLGKGVVKGVEEFTLTIEFKGKTSKFKYPSCFYSFISSDVDGLKEDIDLDLYKWEVTSNVKEKEALAQKSKDRFAEIMKREKEREAEKIEKAKADAMRSKFFSAMHSSKIMDENE